MDGGQTARNGYRWNVMLAMDVRHGLVSQLPVRTLELAPIQNGRFLAHCHRFGTARPRD